MKNKYGKNQVLVLKIDQTDLNGILTNIDLCDDGSYAYMETELVETVMNYLPEYAMGYDTEPISSINMIPRLRETAKSVIKLKKIDKIKSYLDEQTPYDKWDKDVFDFYNSKGIFSELILHFILREFKDTLPLISKIYFKDSSATEAHGFDAVHVSSDNRLWLGETKFYNDGKRGIKALIDDLNSHFVHDYLTEQFMIISRALVHNNEMREKWVQKLSNTRRLEDIFNIITIPLLCIYEDKIAADVLKQVNLGLDGETIYFEHIEKMQKYFTENNDFKNQKRVQTMLILLPVESKNRIVSKMLQKIYSMQNI